jgi:hypothetical protein
MNKISGEKKTEMITDRNGNKFDLPERASINNNKIRESIALMGKCAPTIEEAAKNIKSVSEALSKLKNIQIKKATN